MVERGGRLTIINTEGAPFPPTDGQFRVEYDKNGCSFSLYSVKFQMYLCQGDRHYEIDRHYRNKVNYSYYPLEFRSEKEGIIQNFEISKIGPDGILYIYPKYDRDRKLYLLMIPQSNPTLDSIVIMSELRFAISNCITDPLFCYDALKFESVNGDEGVLIAL